MDEETKKQKTRDEGRGRAADGDDGEKKQQIRREKCGAVDFFFFALLPRRALRRRPTKIRVSLKSLGPPASLIASRLKCAPVLSPSREGDHAEVSSARVKSRDNDLHASDATKTKTTTETVEKFKTLLRAKSSG